MFEDYRLQLKSHLAKLGYHTDWRLLNASDVGVPQLRPRVIIVALRKDIASTIVGGSKKYGGPDLGPTRARRAWAAMGVEGRSLADEGRCPISAACRA